MSSIRIGSKGRHHFVVSLQRFAKASALNRNIAVKLKEKIKDTDQEIHEESPQSTLTTDALIDLVNDAKNKIAKKEVFTNAIRDEIRSYQFK